MNEQYKLHLILKFILPYHHCNNRIFQLICNHNTALSKHYWMLVSVSNDINCWLQNQ